MGLSKKVLIIANVFEVLGINKVFYALNKNRKKIIAYHNVVADKYFDDSLHLEYSISESAFRAQLEQIVKHCNVNLDINDVNSTQITFDDGYQNETQRATKILDEFGVKGIVFCAGDLIDSKKPLDMDLVLYWLSYVKEGIYRIPSLDYKFNITNDYQTRRKALFDLDAKITSEYTLANLVEDLDNLFNFDLLKYDGFNDRFMGSSMENLCDMKERGHIVAAHSNLHYNLAKLSDNQLEDDINKCGQLLQEGIYNSDIFCYPYGNRKDIPKNIDTLLEKNNFSCALSYSNNPNEDFDRFFVPRILLPAIDNKAGINFLLSGARHFLVYKKLFPKFDLKKKQ